MTSKASGEPRDRRSRERAPRSELAAKAATDKASTRGSKVEIRSLLFDADRPDKPVDLDAQTIASLKDRHFLWVDVAGTTDEAARRQFIENVPVDGAAIERFLSAEGGPRLELHGKFFLLRAMAISAALEERAVPLDLIAGLNFVVTIHAEPVEFLTDLDDRIQRDTPLGRIDSAAFSVVLLDGLLTGYLRIADQLEAAVDKLDQEALKPSGVRDLLGDMVALRHRIARIRRDLASHREMFAALARPDFEIIADSAATEHYAALAERFDRAIDAIEGSRESLVGTFDIYATRTGQRTNEIVKTLTIVSVLLLPTTVIAGFMGMNIKAPYSNDDPSVFWVVLAIIAAIATITVVVLRLRRWL